ncbi:hypothetical protein MTO96_039510 [Rhipicephalus appendiculatus]
MQFSLDTPEVSEWNALNITLKQGTNCQLSLRVTRGDGTDGAMAIGPIRMKSGRFIFAENTNASKETAVLKSPKLDVNATSGTCFSIWYFSVHDKPSGISLFAGKQELFYTVTRTGHRWEHTLADFTMPAGGVELEIRASIESGLVALDDLQVTTGPCPQRDFCSWESATSCKFFNGPHNVAQWRRRSASQVGVPDRITQSLEGAYLYLNTTALNSHHPMARLIMSTRQPTEATCVTFWWKGKGARSQLNVYRYSKETSFRDPLLSMRTDDEADWWNARSVTVSSKSYWRQAPIEAISGSNADGFLAIDDVLIDKAGCEDSSKQPRGEFQCGDGKTVPRDRVCDFVPNCDNRADELNCGECDFSEGACGWNLNDARNRGTTAWQVVPIGLVARSPPNGADQRRDGQLAFTQCDS